MFPAWFMEGALFFFIAFIIVLVIFFIRYQRSKIGMVQLAKPPILSFGSSPATLSPGEPFEVLIQLDPQGSDIRAFDILLHYDDTKITFQNPVYPDSIGDDLGANITSSYQLLRGASDRLTHIDSVSKTVRIVGVNTKGSFGSLVVIARVAGVVVSDAPAGSYELFVWDKAETKVGDYVRIRVVERQQKMFTVKESAK